MSLLEWVRVAEDAREQQDDERVATGLESLRMAVGELVPLDRVALIAVDSPERARNEIRAACRRLSTRDPWKALAPAVFRDLVEGLISTVFGLGPLEDLIADETVTEIMVNGTDSVYIERDGRLSRASVSFESDEQVRALIDRILGPLGRRVDESSPMASARLPQGHRVNVVLPPLSLNGPLLTIRAFTRRVMTLAELKARGSFDETVEQFLIWAVGSRRSIAVSGGTGSGKTSLVNLIPRFYDVTKGCVKVGGTDVQKLDAETLRKNIGIVPQRAALFKGTIRSNLLWGKEDATDEELWETLKTAQAENVALDKGGLDAEVEQEGHNFSGGQRQRLTVARALVRKPKILILDDSASALDLKTDAALREAISKLDYKPTVFIVSQRAAAVMNAQLIVVLDEGAVVGMGTHDELMKTCPAYEEIYSSQFKKEADR